MIRSDRDWALVCALAVVTVAVALGRSIPPEPTYAAIEVRGEDEYIVDHNLTYTDCKTMYPYNLCRKENHNAE